MKKKRSINKGYLAIFVREYDLEAERVEQALKRRGFDGQGGSSRPLVIGLRPNPHPQWVEQTVVALFNSGIRIVPYDAGEEEARALLKRLLGHKITALHYGFYLLEYNGNWAVVERL